MQSPKSPRVPFVGWVTREAVPAGQPEVFRDPLPPTAAELCASLMRRRSNGSVSATPRTFL